MTPRNVNQQDVAQVQAVTPPGPERNLLDMNNALRRVNNNARLMSELITFFCEDSPALLTRIDAAKAAGNAKEVARAAHSLAGLSATFDGQCVRDVARRVEELADQDHLADIAADIDLLRQEVDRLCAALRAYPLPTVSN